MWHARVFACALAILAVAGCNPNDPAQSALFAGGLTEAASAIAGNLARGGHAIAAKAVTDGANTVLTAATTAPPPPQPSYDASPPPSAPRSDILGAWEFGRVSQGPLAGPGIPCHPILSNQPGQFGWIVFNKCNDNESFWTLNGASLEFVNDTGQTTTVFSMVNPDYWEGPYVKDPSWQIVHFLRRDAAAPPPAAAPGPLPGQIAEAESLFRGTWTLNGPGSYLALWNNAAVAQMTVVRFDSDAVVIDRVDTPGSSSAGMSAVYTGQISPDRHSVVNTHVVWTWPGHSGFPAESGWAASW